MEDKSPTSQGPLCDQNKKYVHYDLDLGDITLGQGRDTPLGHGQQFCERLSSSNMAVRSYGPDTDFVAMCTVTLTLEI